MKQIQSEPRTLPCWRCYGRGRVRNIGQLEDNFERVYHERRRYPEKWRAMSTKCFVCDGKGEIDNPETAD